MMINTGQFSIVVKAALAFSVMRRMSCGALVTGIRWQGWPSGESTCFLPNECGPGSISTLSVICGLSFLVLYSTLL